MLKKSLIVIVALGLLSVTATAGPPPPLDYEDVPVVMVVNQYATITFAPLQQIQLLETGPDPNLWQGYTTATVTNNCRVTVVATIDPYLPNIGGTLDCLVEADITGFNGDQLSGIYLDPYLTGFSFKLWAQLKNPNPLARPWNPAAQRVATVHVTITAI